MSVDNCIFCKIANGEIPSTTLYEDEDFRVILDLGPATRGHALLLPKNHFANLFELDDVLLEFEEDALRAIAHKAMERETGARGLRAILEEFINPVMYEIPTETTVEKCIITKDVVEGKAQPQYIYNENRKPLHRSRQKKQDKGASA